MNSKLSSRCAVAFFADCPWRQKNMDPETLKEVSEQHEKLYKMKEGLTSKSLGGVIHDATTNADPDTEKKDRTPKGKGKGRRR